MAQHLLEDLVINNSEAGIRELLMQSTDLLYQKTSHGISVIMLACYYKMPKIVSVLVEFADLDIFEAAAANKFDVLAHHIFRQPLTINNYSANGFTPLGLAAYFGNEEIARYLVLKGADVNLGLLFNTKPFDNQLDISILAV